MLHCTYKARKRSTDFLLNVFKEMVYYFWLRAGTTPQENISTNLMNYFGDAVLGDSCGKTSNDYDLSNRIWFLYFIR